MSKKYLLIIILLITAGSLIYMTCRQDILFFSILGNPKFLELIRINIHYQKGDILLYFLLFCLPDILWYTALLLSQKQFYNTDSIFSKILLYITALLPFILEFMQYFGVIAGTFDIIDIIFYLLILLIFITLWKRKKTLKKRSHKRVYFYFLH